MTLKLGNNLALVGDLALAFLNVAFGLREVLSQHNGVHGGNIDDRAVKVG